jgi:peptidoglycan-N-acetylglucosamine deacetylase
MMLFPVRPPGIVKLFYPRFTWRMNPCERKVYLTFDDGPVPVYTEFVLNKLKEFGCKATFFCIGSNVVQHQELYKRIIAEGHAVGNHTYSHINGWRSRRSKYLQDVKRAEESIASDLFRPPYGKIGLRQANDILKKYRIIMWDVLSYDFHEQVSPEKCLNNVITCTRPGSIVVFHDSEKAFPKLREVLPAYLEFLQKNNYSTGVLSFENE